MSYLLAGATVLAVLGPGALSPADPLVLETVEVRRVWNSWGLDHFASPGTLRIATDSCEWLGHYGWLVTDDGEVRLTYVVDCCSERGCLENCGLVADVNERELAHKNAYIVIWERTKNTN